MSRVKKVKTLLHAAIQAELTGARLVLQGLVALSVIILVATESHYNFFTNDKDWCYQWQAFGVAHEGYTDMGGACSPLMPGKSASGWPTIVFVVLAVLSVALIVMGSMMFKKVISGRAEVGYNQDHLILTVVCAVHEAFWMTLAARLIGASSAMEMMVFFVIGFVNSVSLLNAVPGHWLTAYIQDLMLALPAIALVFSHAQTTVSERENNLDINHSVINGAVWLTVAFLALRTLGYLANHIRVQANGWEKAVQAEAMFTGDVQQFQTSKRFKSKANWWAVLFGELPLMMGFTAGLIWLAVNLGDDDFKPDYTNATNMHTAGVVALIINGVNQKCSNWNVGSSFPLAILGAYVFYYTYRVVSSVWLKGKVSRAVLTNEDFLYAIVNAFTDFMLTVMWCYSVGIRDAYVVFGCGFLMAWQAMIWYDINFQMGGKSSLGDTFTLLSSKVMVDAFVLAIIGMNMFDLPEGVMEFEDKHWQVILSLWLTYLCSQALIVGCVAYQSLQKPSAKRQSNTRVEYIHLFKTWVDISLKATFALLFPYLALPATRDAVQCANIGYNIF